MPRGVYPHTHIKPRNYPTEIVDQVVHMYCVEGLTVQEVQERLPKGFKAQRIIERHIPVRRRAAKRDQSGPKNHMWKGAEITYGAAHVRAESRYGRASTLPCVDCGDLAKDWSYQHDCPGEVLSDIGVAYCPHPEHYEPRCRRCHRAYDRKEVMPNV